MSGSNMPRFVVIGAPILAALVGMHWLDPARDAPIVRSVQQPSLEGYLSAAHSRLEAPAGTADPSCVAVNASGFKVAQTPHHVYSTGQAPDGKVLTEETIEDGDEAYSREDAGRWQRRPETRRDRLELMRKRSVRIFACKNLGEQIVAGEATTEFGYRGRGTNFDSRIWISNSTGLTLRQTLTMPHIGSVDMRFDYTNVHAPAIP